MDVPVLFLSLGEAGISGILVAAKSRKFNSSSTVCGFESHPLCHSVSGFLSLGALLRQVLILRPVARKSHPRQCPFFSRFGEWRAFGPSFSGALTISAVSSPRSAALISEKLALSPIAHRTTGVPVVGHTITCGGASLAFTGEDDTRLKIAMTTATTDCGRFILVEFMAQNIRLCTRV